MDNRDCRMPDRVRRGVHRSSTQKLTMNRRKRYRLRPRSPLAAAAPTTVPGVSILRPLKGLDTNLYENLESTFTQEYPSFEILLSVAEENDQALPIVRDLMAKYPQVDATVIIGSSVPLPARSGSPKTQERK